MTFFTVPSRWTLLIRLVIVGTFYQFQHYSIYYLVFSFIFAGSSMQEDLGISNFEYSILSGPCTLFVTAFSIMPLAGLADRSLRPIVFLIVCACLSSAFTICNTFAISFWTLLWPRVAFSFVSSPITPLNLRILTDRFVSNERGTSSSLYFLTVYIGISLCSAFLYVCSIIGWRLSYAIIGTTSLLASVVSLICLSSMQTQSKASPISSDIKSLFSCKTLNYSVIGLSFKYISQFVRASFESIFFARMYSNKIGFYSLLNTFFILASPVSSIILGRVSDKLVDRFPSIKSVLCAISMIAPVPFMVVMYLTDNFAVAMSCLGVSSLMSEAYIGVSYAIMINVTLPKLKALQTAWMMSITMIIGGIAVTIIGYLYKSLWDLRIALICASAGPLILSAGMYCLVYKVYSKDFEEFTRKFGVYKELINNSITK